MWWEQATSDHAILLLLRRVGAKPCHQLHYLQMVTEKLSKAYFWRNGPPAVLSHAAFLRFLTALNSRSKSDRERIAALLGYKDSDQLRWAINKMSPLAHELERLAPALAGPNGPNPEYPWPTSTPTEAPAHHEFALWIRLRQSTDGHNLLRLIDRAVATFPQYA